MLILVALAFALRQSVAAAFNQRPLLILFVFPVLLSAYIGGLGPGLAATALVALGTCYFFVPPPYSFRIAAGHDLLQWSMLVLNCACICLLMEGLHRARRRAEQAGALRSRMDSIVASAPGAIYSFEMRADGTACFPYASPAVPEIFGLDPAELARTAAPLFDRIHLEDLPAFEASVLRSARELTTWHGVFRYRHPTRGEIWVEGHSAPNRLPDGGTVWHGIALDSTERRLMELSVKDSRAFMQATMDSLTAHLCVLDSDGLILKVNQAWREFASASGPIGRDAGEGTNYLEVCARAQGDGASVARAFADGIRDVMAGRREVFELEYACHSPTEQRWFLGRVTRFKGMNPGQVVVSHESITAQKRAEAALLRSETLHRALIDTIPDMVWLKDPEGVYLGCNPTFGRFFGKPEAELLGRTDYDIVAKELADFFRSHDRRAMAAGGPSVNEEWLTSADGRYRGLFETIKTPMRGADGKVVGVLGIARDITARKRAEEALARQIDELHRWQAVTLGRENRIAELKGEVNAMAARAGLEKPYTEPLDLPPADTA